jgi:hypothetical protein
MSCAKKQQHMEKWMVSVTTQKKENFIVSFIAAAGEQNKKITTSQKFSFQFLKGY